MRSATSSNAWTLAGLCATALIVAAGVMLGLPRFAQDPGYHAWIDQRPWLGLSNAADVLSNLGFAAVGLTALHRLRLGKLRFLDPHEHLPYRVLFASVVLVAAGSVWYHLAPTNASLFWDRLPMSLAFMALLAAVIGDRVGARAGRLALPWLCALGPLSVVYWIASESAGMGDLRPYLLVQGLALALVPLLLWLTPPRYTRAGDLLLALTLYALALVAERLDKAIFEATGWISGHTLKHLLAAVALAWVWRMLEKRVRA